MTDIASEYTDIARIASLSGLKGRLLLRSSDSLFDALREGDVLHFVPPVIDAPRSSAIKEIELSDDAAKVWFSGIYDPDVARMLVGCTCLVRDEDMVGRMPQETIPNPELCIGKGWTLADEVAGLRHRIREVVEYPSQLMAVVDVQGADGTFAREAMVPMADDLIVGIDPDSRCVRMSLPNGLLDL